MTKLINVHPGEVLLEEFLRPMGISQNKIARAMKISPRRVNEIIHGNRAITADTAIRLERVLGVSAGFWMGLQADYDLEEAIKSVGSSIDSIRPIAA